MFFTTCSFVRSNSCEILENQTQKHKMRRLFGSSARVLGMSKQRTDVKPTEFFAPQEELVQRQASSVFIVFFHSRPWV